MVLFAEKEDLAANIVNQPGKIACIRSEQLKYLKKRIFSYVP